MYGLDTSPKLATRDGKRLFDRFADALAMESIRQLLRRELVHGGQRGAAEAAGVGRTVVRKLLEMAAVPQRRHWRQLNDWAADRPEVTPALESVCLAVLTETVPAAQRLHARQELAATIARVFDASAKEHPAWLKEELAGITKPARR